jgi:hypothetical protein
MILVRADSAECWGGLAAQRLVVVVPATGAPGKRELAIRSPGQQPSLHIFVADVVTGFDLTIGLPHLSEQPLLVGDVGVNGVGNEKIRTAAGSLRQTSEPFLGPQLQPYAER